MRGAHHLHRFLSLNRFLDHGVQAELGEPAQPHLTLREREIVALVGRGLSNKEIARELCIELPTVKNHVHRILDKLGVSRRAEAAALVGNVGEGLRVPGTSTSPA